MALRHPQFRARGSKLAGLWGMQWKVEGMGMLMERG